ncbi:MAG: hypothetical protein H6735_17910 [Alphaproteobacteria bacterium]|nr:hypothetical protein [Alphaproteobacteria bacterium]
MVALLALVTGCIDPDVGQVRLLIDRPIPATPCADGQTCVVAVGDERVALGSAGLVEVDVSVEQNLCIVPFPDDVAWAGDVGFVDTAQLARVISAQACEVAEDGTCIPLATQDDPKLFLIELGADGKAICEALRPSDFVEAP